MSKYIIVDLSSGTTATATVQQYIKRNQIIGSGDTQVFNEGNNVIIFSSGGTGGGTSYSFNNGLTESAGVVHLGGTYYQPVNIYGTTGFSVTHHRTISHANVYDDYESNTGKSITLRHRYTVPDGSVPIDYSNSLTIDKNGFAFQTAAFDSYDEPIFSGGSTTNISGYGIYTTTKDVTGRTSTTMNVGYTINLKAYQTTDANYDNAYIDIQGNGIEITRVNGYADFSKIRIDEEEINGSTTEDNRGVYLHTKDPNFRGMRYKAEDQFGTPNTLYRNKFISTSIPDVGWVHSRLNSGTASITGSSLSVLGRASNSSGVFASIAAGTDGHVLRRSGTALGFGTLASGAFASNTIARSVLTNAAATTIVGNATAGSAPLTDIAASSNGQVLRRFNNQLGFGQITGTTSVSMNNNRLLGRTTSSFGLVEEISIGSGLSLSSGTLRATGSGDEYSLQFKYNGAITGTSRLTYDPSGNQLQMKNYDGSEVIFYLNQGSFTVENVGFFNLRSNSSTLIESPSLYLNNQKFPQSDSGATNQYLTTDGNGNLSWATPAGAGGNTTGVTVQSISATTNINSSSYAGKTLEVSGSSNITLTFGTSFPINGQVTVINLHPTNTVTIAVSGLVSTMTATGLNGQYAGAQFWRTGNNLRGIGELT